MATQRRRGAAALPLVTASATGCRSDLGAGSADPAPSPTAAAKPLATTEADWAGVGEAPGRQGKLSSAVYRVGPPRSDLSVRSPGKVRRGRALGSYAAFAPVKPRW